MSQTEAKEEDSQDIHRKLSQLHLQHQDDDDHHDATSTAGKLPPHSSSPLPPPAAASTTITERKTSASSSIESPSTPIYDYAAKTFGHCTVSIKWGGEDRGRILVASKDIDQAGTVVFEEDALASWDSCEDYETLQAALMIESSLPVTPHRDIILDLCASNTTLSEQATDDMIEALPGRPPAGSGRRLPPGQFRHLLSVIESNRHELRYDDRSGRPPRHGLFPLGAMINHDCHPSCGFRTSLHGPDRLAIITYRPIKQGEELTISYLDELYQPTHQRRAHLLRNYYFLCRCDNCQSPVDKTRAFVCPQCQGAEGKVAVLYPPRRVTSSPPPPSSSSPLSPCPDQALAPWQPCNQCGYQVSFVTAGLVRQTEETVGRFESAVRCVEQLVDRSSGLVPLAFHESHYLIQEAMYDRCRMYVTETRGEESYTRGLGYIDACLRYARVEDKANLYGWKAHLCVCLGRTKEAQVAYRVAARMATKLHADGGDFYTALSRNTPSNDQDLLRVMGQIASNPPPPLPSSTNAER